MKKFKTKMISIMLVMSVMISTLAFTSVNANALISSDHPTPIGYLTVDVNNPIQIDAREYEEYSWYLVYFTPDQTGAYTFNFNSTAVGIYDNYNGVFEYGWINAEGNRVTTMLEGDSKPFTLDLIGGQTYYLQLRISKTDITTLSVIPHQHQYDCSWCKFGALETYHYHKCATCGIVNTTTTMHNVTYDFESLVLLANGKHQLPKFKYAYDENGQDVSNQLSIIGVYSVKDDPVYTSKKYDYNSMGAKPGVYYFRVSDGWYKTSLYKFEVVDANSSKAEVIKPNKTSIKKITPKSKAFLVEWIYQRDNAHGYQIQYATDKKFKKNKKTVTVAKNPAKSKTISKLKPKKKYYVRVRTYITINGKKKYSSWSAVKTVTTKK